MAKLSARKSQGKCFVCWQKITEKTNVLRPALKFQGKLYHQDCWEKVYKQRKVAQTKKARTRRSY